MSERKPKRIIVNVAFRGGVRHWDGYTSCNKFLAIASRKDAPVYRRGFDIIHVPTGKTVFFERGLREARLLCGVLSGLDVKWHHKKPKLKEFQEETQQWLMPLFKALNMVLYHI